MAAPDTGSAGPCFVLRACCRRGRDQARGNLEPVDLPECESSCARGLGGGDAMEEVAGHQREWRIAAHEAAHAVVIAKLGGEISIVRLDPPARVEWAASKMRIPLFRAVIALAGPVGERWAENRIVRAFNDQLDPAFAAVRAGVAGGCDDCTAMWWSRMAVMIKGGDEEDPEQVFAAWREAELMAIEMVTKRPNFTSIIRLAKILMTNGVASEDEVWSCLGENILSSPWPYEPEPEEKTIWLTF